MSSSNASLLATHIIEDVMRYGDDADDKE